MQGASISRWTMAYFASAIVSLMVGLAALGSGYGVPTAGLGAPATLAVVHLIAIGWLGILFCGALLQFVPVLAATHLRLPWLAGPALLLLIGGLVLLVTGFVAIDGELDIDLAILPVAGAGLVAGFSAVVVSLAKTILCREAVDAPGVLVLAGLAALAVTVGMGFAFAMALSGQFDLPLLSSVLPSLVPYHASSGLLGWMTVTAIGVSYRLFAMFMLAPENGNRDRAVARFAIVALLALYVGLVLEIVRPPHATVPSMLAVALAVALVAVYGRDVWRMYGARRRKALELNSMAGLAALLFLGAGTALLAFAVFSVDASLAPAAFYLLGMGWLSGLGLSQLYKIVPFLTWLEAYGPVMGKSQVPRVQDLVDERHAKLWFGVFYLAVAAGAGAILIDAELVFRAASWCQCSAVLALAVEYLRARRLAYVPGNLHPPRGAARPHLFYAITTSKE